MTQYPGNEPETPDPTAPISATPTPIEPEVGYWEKQAQEAAQEKGQEQGSPWGTPGSAAPASGSDNPWATPSVGAPVPASPAAPPAYQQAPQGYQAAPGDNPYASSYQMVPDHPSATTALVLGLISLIGGFLCLGLTFILGPFAWVIGARVVREVDASGGQLRGRGNGQAGMIMGIISTALLVLGLLGLIALFVIGAASGY